MKLNHRQIQFLFWLLFNEQIVLNTHSHLHDYHHYHHQSSLSSSLSALALSLLERCWQKMYKESKDSHINRRNAKIKTDSLLWVNSEIRKMMNQTNYSRNGKEHTKNISWKAGVKENKDVDEG